MGGFGAFLLLFFFFWLEKTVVDSEFNDLGWLRDAGTETWLLEFRGGGVKTSSGLLGWCLGLRIYENETFALLEQSVFVSWS